MKARFDALKSFIPSLYASSTKTITNMVSSITMNESEYLQKTETTEKDILTLLTSKIEMEVILALKILIIDVQNGKDISSFIPRILEIFALTKNYFAKRLTLNLIDHISLTKKNELLLLFNTINKLSNDSDVLNRLSLVHVIGSLRNQPDISNDACKQLLLFTNDSNPLIRRMSLIIIANYLKTNKELHKEIDFTNLLTKYINDPHPLVYSAFFYAITEIQWTDYVSVGLLLKFTDIVKDLNVIDECYYERVVFSLVNFTKVYLILNMSANASYVEKLFTALYNVIKHSTNTFKVITSFCGIYDLILDLSKDNNNTSLTLYDKILFKNDYKRLSKLSLHLLKLYLQVQSTPNNSLYLINVLDIILHFIQNKNKRLFTIISNVLYTKYNYFYININEINCIIEYKLKILSHLVNESNVKNILDEYKRILNYPNKNIKRGIISSMHSICLNENTNKSTKVTVIEKLVDFLKIKNDFVINYIIIALSDLIDDIENKKYILVYSIKNYNKTITTPHAKANVITMILNNISVIPTVSIDFYRRLLLDVDNESDEVKRSIVQMSYEIWYMKDIILKNYDESKLNEMNGIIVNMVNYAIEKMLYDNNYTTREKARVVKAMIEHLKNKKKKEGDTVVMENKNKNEKVIKHNNDNTLFMEVLSNHRNDSHSKMFSYDVIDEDTKEKMKMISFGDIVNATSNIQVQKEGNNDNNSNNNKIVSEQEKYKSCKQDESQINNQISNINSGIDIEKKKQELKNQLDEFLNDNDENSDDDDDFQIEIKRG